MNNKKTFNGIPRNLSFKIICSHRKSRETKANKCGLKAKTYIYEKTRLYWVALFVKQYKFTNY